MRNTTSRRRGERKKKDKKKRKIKTTHKNERWKAAGRARRFLPQQDALTDRVLMTTRRCTAFYFTTNGLFHGPYIQYVEVFFISLLLFVLRPSVRNVYSASHVSGARLGRTMRFLHTASVVTVNPCRKMIFIPCWRKPPGSRILILASNCWRLRNPPCLLSLTLSFVSELLCLHSCLLSCVGPRIKKPRVWLPAA
jgi:hypothetical protein